MNKIIPLLLIMGLSACTSNQPQVVNDEPSAEVMVVNVAPATVPCVGVAPMQCLVVDGLLFYQRIVGFQFEKGYHYSLKIEKVKRYTRETVPADKSLYQYNLLEILDKTKVSER